MKNNPILKKCAECHQTKELRFFHKHRNGKHGRSARCADCIGQRRVRRRETDQDWNQIKREFNARNGRLRRDPETIRFHVEHPSFS